MRMLCMIYTIFMISQFIKYKLCSADNNGNSFQVYCLVLPCVKQIFRMKQRAELHSLVYNSVNVAESSIFTDRHHRGCDFFFCSTLGASE